MARCTLLEAWASHKSFRRKDRGEPPSANGREVDLHGEKRSNETHQSATDPDARLYKKSKCSEAKMSYLRHALMENRIGTRFFNKLLGPRDNWPAVFGSSDKETEIWRACQIVRHCGGREIPNFCIL